MRTFSTPESALKGEITKLGIIECVFAVAIYVAIALRLHTFRYFYLAIAVAPLTLFRTDESTEWTLQAFQALCKVQGKIEGIYDALTPRRGVTLFGVIIGVLFLFMGVPFIIMGFLLIMGVLLIRPIIMGGLIFVLFASPQLSSVAGMVYGFVRRPLRTIAEMPRNWVRQALCTDFAHPPEPPGELLPSPDSTFITFRTLITFVKGEGWIALPPTLIVAVLMFLPPLLYRISFKATSVCYLPFLWVAQTTTGTKLPLKVRLERVTKGELEKARRWLSIVVLGVFVLAAALHFGVIDSTSVASKLPVEFAAVNLIGAMKSFHWWHATLLADALLTFCLLFFSDAALSRMDTQVWSEPFVANTLSMTSFLRGALAVLTMTYGCWVAILNVVPAGVRGFLLML